MAESLQRTSGQSSPLKECLRRKMPGKLLMVELVEKPAFASNSKLTPTQKMGKSFERSLTKWLRRRTKSPILSQTWVRYSDQHGEGWACPDIIIPEERILIECKRTYTREADAQLLLVYKPLVDRLWPGSWRMIVACKFWAGPIRPLIADPFEAPIGLTYYIHR